MGGLWSYIRGPPPDPRVPVKGALPRLKNLCTLHFRGLIGFFVPLFLLSWQGEYGRHDKTVQCVWIWMFWFFLIQPVDIPVTGLIPIFILPMAGVMSTLATCSCYMTENMILFLLTGMLILLLNNSEFDRRTALSIICSGDSSQFSPLRLVCKCSFAAYFLSMFSNRLIVTSSITSMITPTFIDLKGYTSKLKSNEPNLDTARYIINNAIHTSSAIGSLAILHSAYATLTFRNIWSENAGARNEYPDIFNYLHYSIFAFPVSLIMWILNVSYHMILLCICVNKPISQSSRAELRRSLLKIKSTLPRNTTAHEYLTVFFTVLALILFFFRWSSFLKMGWASFRKHPLAPEIPLLKDATVAAFIVIICHILPKSCGFIKLCKAKKKSQLPPTKPESAILWWRFVDKNLNYGYIFLLGCGVALNTAIRSSGLNIRLSEGLGKIINTQTWTVGIFIVCLISVILSNVMSGVAACVIFLPFVLNMSSSIASLPWAYNTHLAALAVGMGSSLGFMFPFLYTPAFFCHHVGKVPVKKMASISIGSVIICFLVLWVSMIGWAPYIWGTRILPRSIGIPIPILTTTEKTEFVTGGDAPPDR